jgi:hypothetical protein
MGSWVQRLEFLPSCPEVAELVDRRRSWREREYIKRLGEHLLEVVLRCDADGDVWIELLAGCFWDERRDVVDGRLVDLGVVRRGDERGGGPGFLSERRNTPQSYFCPANNRIRASAYSLTLSHEGHGIRPVK